MRVADGFPDDTLAPEAVLRLRAQSVQAMWRKSVLDPAEGQQAAIHVAPCCSSTYPELRSLPPRRSGAWIRSSDQVSRRKDYDTGVHYIRRGAIDPAIIYFKDVVTAYPTQPTARLAWLRLHELYTKIRWKDDASGRLRCDVEAYPDTDKIDVRRQGARSVARSLKKRRPAQYVKVKKDTVAISLGALARPGPARTLRSTRTVAFSCASGFSGAASIRHIPATCWSRFDAIEALALDRLQVVPAASSQPLNQWRGENGQPNTDWP